MVKGTVKWFNSRKGFGFINSEEGNDVFVHYTALAGTDDEYKTLNENDKVEFEVTEGQKGPQASKPKKLHLNLTLMVEAAVEIAISLNELV